MLDAAAALVEAASRVLPQERSKQVVREHRKSLIALTRNHNKGTGVPTALRKSHPRIHPCASGI